MPRRAPAPLRRPRRRAPAALRRAPAAVLAALALVAGVTVLAAPLPGGTQEPPPDPPPGPPSGTTDAGADRPLGPLPELAPELADVAVSSAAHDAALARRARLGDERRAAIDLAARKDAEILELTARDLELTEQIDDAVAHAEFWEAKADRVAGELREMAISSYVSGAAGSLDPLLALDARAQQEMATADVLVGSLVERQQAELAQAVRNGRHNRNVAEISTAVRDGVRDGLVTATEVRDGAVADEARLAVELLDAAVEVEEERRMAQVVGTGFPLVVLDAYWKGSQVAAVETPGCGVPWWALAGIGLVESRHGTYGGAEVRADGSLTRPIIGIPLTGSGGTAHIPDSDGGLIDGDPVYDRAAGPMQFIPQTWARWGRDGNGDGVVDIQNLYDAAAGAAAYLCASGPMADDDGLRRGFFSYNRSLEYVESVLAHAHGYAGRIALDRG